MSEEMFQLLMEEIRDIKAVMATKDDINEIRNEMTKFATKEDINEIRNEMTKFATKEDINEIRNEMTKFATKDDINELHDKIDLVATELNQSVLTLLKIIDEKFTEILNPQQEQLDKHESTIEVLNKRTLYVESEQLRIKKQLSMA